MKLLLVLVLVGVARGWFLSGVVQTVEQKAGELAQKVEQKAGELIHTVGQKAGELANTVKQKGGELVNTVEQKAGELAHTVEQKAGEFANTVQQKAGEVANTVGGVVDTVKTKVGEAVDTAKHVGQEIGHAIDTAKAVGQGVSQTAKDFFPYAGQVGKDLLKEGLTDTLHMVGSVTDQVGKAIIDQFRKRDNTLELLSKGKQLMTDLTALLNLGNSQYSQVIDQIFGKVQVIAKKVKAAEMDPKEAILMLDDLIAKHTSLSKEFLEALERDVSIVAQQIFNQNKRDVASTLGSAVAHAVQPALGNITNLLNQMKTSIVGLNSGNVFNILSDLLQKNA